MHTHTLRMTYINNNYGNATKYNKQSIGERNLTLF